MSLKKIFWVSLVITIMLHPINGCADEDSKFVQLGLNAATAMASKRDVVEGLRQTASDEYTDWLWDSVGGIESFMTGDPEAKIPEAREKIGKIVDTVKAIETFSIAMTEGRYDDAAFTAIDQGVGAIDNPLVSLTWEMAKLTYQSHKMLESSQAALDIERLYCICSNDRRLMGVVDPDSDSPPLIPETAKMADYFFDKYLITNDSTRALVKSYVKTALGEQWPEESWSEYMKSWMSIGSGIDTKKSAEIRLLANEWRNKARGWIMHLIKDVNKQAKLSWEQARLRKQMAEFDAFVKRVSHFYHNDFDRMLKEFLEIKKNKAAEKNLVKLPAKSKQEYKKMLSMVNQINGASLKKAYSLEKTIDRWQLNCLEAASRMERINPSLSRALYAEREKWLKLKLKLNDKVDALEENISTDVISTKFPAYKGDPKYREAYYEDKTKAKDYYSKYFSKILKKFDFSSVSATVQVFDIDKKPMRLSLTGNESELEKKITLQLNKGDFIGAKNIIDFWKKDVLIAKSQYFHKIRQKMQEVIANRPSEVQDTIPDNEAWGAAIHIAKDVLENLLSASQLEYNTELSKLLHINKAYHSLAEVLKRREELFIEQCNRIAVVLPTPGLSNILYNRAVKLLKEADNITYTYMPHPVEQPPILAYQIPLQLSKLLPPVDNNPGLPLVMVNEATDLRNKFAEWDEVIKEFHNLDIPSASEVDQIRVLVDPSFNPLDNINKITQSIESIKELRMLPAQLDVAVHRLELIQKNKEIDRDNIEKKLKRITMFFKELEEKKLIERGGINDDYRVVLPARLLNGMLLMTEPFPHYATRKELDKIVEPILKAWDSLPHNIRSFIRSNAPLHFNRWEKIMSLNNIKAARCSNFILLGRSSAPIYEDNLKRALSLALNVRARDPKYSKIMEKIAQLVPGLMDIPTKEDIQREDQRKAAMHHLTLKQYYRKFSPSKQVIYYVLTDAAKKAMHSKKLISCDIGRMYTHLAQRVEQLNGDYHAYEAELNRKIAEKESERIQKKEYMKAEEQGDQDLRSMSPFRLAGFYGYSIENARLNSRSLQNARGTVILTKENLRLGEIVIDAKLFTTKQAKKMLFSIDGGRTWSQIPVASDIHFAFTPLSDRYYDFILKIQTADGREPMVKLFPNVDKFLFKDVNFNTLIVKTVKEIANAYERKDINAFSRYISRDYLGNKALLEEGVRFDFDLFNNIRLLIYINRIEKRSNFFVVTTKWDKTQTPIKTGEEQRTSGHTTFMFVLEDGKMKIKNLRGDLIYATLSPEIAQASGKSPSVVSKIRTARDERNPEQPGAGEVEDSGGVTSSSAALTVYTTPILNVPGFPGIGFDATSNVEVTAASSNSDMDFEDNLIFGTTGLQKITGQTFNQITEAPTSGYTTAGVINEGAGTVYVFITREGYYAKMEILSFDGTPGGNLQFKFAVQTDGSTNLTTN